MIERNEQNDAALEEAEKMLLEGNRFYEKGDYNSAICWYEKAANKGYAEAQFELGFLYYFNLKDFIKAAHWFEMAAQQGYIYAQMYLGYMFCDGEGVEKNGEKGIAWLKKAAEQGNSTAQYGLGVIYMTGKGIDPDYKLARYWMEKAADNGNEDAVQNLKDNAIEEVEKLDKILKKISSREQEMSTDNADEGKN